MTASYPGSIAAYGQTGFHNTNTLGNSPLLADITGLPSTFEVENASSTTTWPTTNFCVRIDSEVIFVSSRTGNVCTIGERGHDGTGATDHSAGADCRVVMDAGALNKIQDEVVAIETALGTNLSNTVTPSGSATLTNKTIDDSTNTVRANKLATSGTPVTISTTAPSSGQALIATSSSAAAWNSTMAGWTESGSNTSTSDGVIVGGTAQTPSGTISTGVSIYSNYPIKVVTNGNNQIPAILQYSFNGITGSVSSPTAITSGMTISYYSAQGCYTSGTYLEGGNIIFSASENWGGSNQGTAFSITSKKNADVNQYKMFEIYDYDVAIGDLANSLSTSATKGFIYIKSCAGTPTGTPVNRNRYSGSGRAMVWDSSNKKLYIWDDGTSSWKGSAAFT